MLIEIMYPEFITFGEMETIHYFELISKQENCHQDIEIVKTYYHDQPRFAQEKVDLIFFGPMAQLNMERVYKKLLPFREELLATIENGCYFFALNNILDLFASKLEVKDGAPAHCLNLFPYRAVRDYAHRFSENVLAEIEDQLIYGSKAGFTNYYGNENNYIYKAIQPQIGFNMESPLGGYKYKNAYLLELSGNVLLTNPYFLNLFRGIFAVEGDLPFEADLVAVYEENLRLLKKNKDFAKFIK